MNKKYTKGTLLACCLFSIILLFVYGITSYLPSEVEKTLKDAGNNRVELLKVIEHFKAQKNPQKLSAACYLIKNMRDMYHSEGNGVDEYKKFFNTVADLSVSDTSFRRTWDSLQKIYVPEKLGTVKVVKDPESVHADLLIQHIDAAFDAWHYPWAKNLNFDEFCEYILPYKLINESPELWNKKIQQKYQWLLDSMKTDDDPRKACLLLDQTLRKNFWINSLFRSTWDFRYSDLAKVFDKVHTRGCFYATQYATYISRAMGLPVAIDFTPYWANKSGGHEWNALIVDGKPLPFIGTESDPGKTKVEAAFSRKRAKIFRRTFSIQEDNPLKFASTVTAVPKLFRDAHIRDVTSEYEPVSNVNPKLDREVSTARVAYLCVYNGQDWKPVSWSKVNEKGYGDFTGMGRGIAYLPMYCEDEQMFPAGAPLIVRMSGEITTLSANQNKKRTITVKSKSFDGVKIAKDKEYELFYWDPVSMWVSLGKKKAISNSLAFENVPTDALFIIHSDDKPETERIFTYENGEQKFW